jgi:hypothetical protein
VNRASLISYACLVLFVSHAYSQQLIYAVAVGETPASFRARFGSKPWPMSIDQRLAMLRRTRKTEIYSASMTDGKRTLLFSDEGLNFEISPYSGKYTYFIYEIPSWKLQYSIELSKLLRLHCADCLPSSAVWSADGSRFFLTLDLGDEDGIADESQDRPGTYVISEDGTELGALAAQSGRIQLTGYHRQASIAPYLIGQFSNGNYLFRDYALKKGPSPKAPLQSQAILVISGPDFKVQQQIPLERLRLAQFQPSASGKYLAFVEDRQTPDYRTERDFWAKDLQSGEEKELFAAPPPNPPTSLEPNVTVVPLGWIEK